MVNVRAINENRLKHWRDKLNRQSQTAIVLIGIGENEKAGQLTVYTTEKRSQAELLQYMEHAVAELKLKMGQPAVPVKNNQVQKTFQFSGDGINQFEICKVCKMPRGTHYNEVCPIQ